MMKVKDGKITEIDTFSGHYKPTQENLYNVAFLKSELKNVFADDIKITTASFSHNKRKRYTRKHYTFRNYKAICTKNGNERNR